MHDKESGLAIISLAILEQPYAMIEFYTYPGGASHAHLSEGGKVRAVPQGLDLSCSDFCGCSPETSPCEHDQLFLAGWVEGTAQAEQVYAQKDLDLAEDLGRAAGFTSMRPPRNYSWISA